MNNYDEEYVKKEIVKRNAALTSLIVKAPWDVTSATCNAIYRAKDALLHYFNEESLRNEDFCTEFAKVTLDTVEDYKQSITMYGCKIYDKGPLRKFMKLYTQPLE